MPIASIPLRPSVPDQRIKVTLDGRRFTLRVRWNNTAAAADTTTPDADGTWFLDLEDAQGTIVASKALLQGSDVLRQHRYDPRCPQGFLIVSAGALEVDPAFDSWGSTHLLLYAGLA